MENLEQEQMMQQEGMSPDMQQQGMAGADMQERLMAVVGVFSTMSDMYVDTKVDLVSVTNKLAEMQGIEGMNSAEVLSGCIAKADSMLAQIMQLLGAEYQEPMIADTMGAQVMPEEEGTYE